jgi:hypothetical protein
VIIYAMMVFGECCVNVKLLISIFYCLSKVFHYNFLVTKRKVEIPESCPVRDRVGRQIMGSITS